MLGDTRNDATTENAPSLRRFILPGLFVLALFVTLWARRPAPVKAAPQWEFSGQIFGTSYHLKVIPTNNSDDRAAVEAAVKAELARVNACLSTWLQDSELSKLNRNTKTSAVPISPMLAEVLLESARVHKLSGGAFDITIKPLVELWGFGNEEVVKAPTPESLAEARASIGASALKLDVKKQRLIRGRAGLKIDVSAIGKGYGVDRVGKTLEDLSYTRYLVEIGGEVRARGRNRHGQSWTVGVEKPDGGPQEVAEVVPLPDLSIATSGNYRNFRTLAGKTVTHIIDARSGQAVSHQLGSVSVLDPSCMRADALATALYVLGEEDGFALAEREAIPALFLTPRIAGKPPRRRATSAFKQVLKGHRKP